MAFKKFLKTHVSCPTQPEFPIQQPTRCLTGNLHMLTCPACINSGSHSSHFHHFPSLPADSTPTCQPAGNCHCCHWSFPLIFCPPLSILTCPVKEDLTNLMARQVTVPALVQLILIPTLRFPVHGIILLNVTSHLVSCSPAHQTPASPHQPDQHARSSPDSLGDGSMSS